MSNSKTLERQSSLPGEFVSGIGVWVPPHPDLKPKDEIQPICISIRSIDNLPVKVNIFLNLQYFIYVYAYQRNDIISRIFIGIIRQMHLPYRSHSLWFFSSTFLWSKMDRPIRYYTYSRWQTCFTQYWLSLRKFTLLFKLFLILKSKLLFNIHSIYFICGMCRISTSIRPRQRPA